MQPASTFEALDASGYDVTPPTSLGPAPQLQWLEVSLLVVDTSYQRHVASRASRRSIKRIADRFDWRKFVPVIVSPVMGGLYAIVDGQHRTTGAILAGVTTVPCSIIQADAVGQAEAFAAINKQVTAVTAIQIYKVTLAAGDAEARRLKRVADAAGVAILTSNKSGRDVLPNETHAIAAIRKGLFLHGDKVVVLALTLLRLRASPEYKALTAGNILATAAAVSGLDGVEDRATLVANTRDTDYNGLYRTAQRQAVEDRSKSTLQHHGELIGAALCAG